MSWSALQAVAEVIGAIAVVASLVYLAIQVRHTVILSYFHQPGIGARWEERRAAYSEPFRQFLETSDPPPVRIRTTEDLRPDSAARNPIGPDDSVP